jgi:N,N'-diacetylchitobiose transport system permease protein
MRSIQTKPATDHLPYWLAGPAIAVLVVTVLLPLSQLLVISLQDYGLRAIFTGSGTFIGLANYIALGADPGALQMLARTIAFTASLVAGNMIIGTGLAMFVHRLGPRMRWAVLSVLMTSWAMPSVGAILIWQWMFQPLYGVVNWLVTQLAIFGDMRQFDWTSTSLSGFFIVWLLIVWKSVPFVVVTVYAARSQIAEDLYDAARIDGANALRSFRYITMPLLAPTLYVVLTLQIIWDFNIFNEIWILTSGGPNGGTTTAGIWMFIEGFNKNAYGRASAMAVAVAAFLCLIAAGYARGIIRTVERP